MPRSSRRLPRVALTLAIVGLGVYAKIAPSGAHLGLGG
jgi:hypothetical protein